MADLGNTYYSNRSYYPHINYSVSYRETGRTASSVSYNVSVTYTRVTSHWYGFNIYLKYQIGSVVSEVLLKDNTDYQSKSISFDVTSSTDANGGTLYAKMYSYSTNDGTHWQNGFDSGNCTVNKSSIFSPPPQVAWCSIEGNYCEGGTTTIRFGGQAPVTNYKIYCREWRRIGDDYGGWWEHGTDPTHSGVYNIGHGKVNGDAFQMGVAQVNGPYESAIKETGWIYHQGANVWNGNWNGFGQLRAWNGSSWVQAYARVWNGSAWVIAQ